MVEEETRLENGSPAASADGDPVDDTEYDEDGDVLDLDAEEDLEQVMRAATEAVESAEAEKRVDVARLEQELADLRDRSMRTLADFDNYRKRAERERQEAKRFALLEPMRDLLDVVDNLERAVAAPGSVEDLRQGVEMILRQLDELLRRYGVTPVDAEGEAFDPTVHEAVASKESDAVDEAVVDQEYQRGYLLHDRLLRPARVVVAVPVDAEGGPEDQADREEDGPAS
ncbi:MAG: nucleotide exchange factor GrpE [Acidobacteriota bacterium]|jgi:molecular chaperone GrpE